MRLALCLVIVLVSGLFGLPQIAAAQSVASPAIQRVTLQPDTGVLRITGTSLGADLVVTVDGQRVTALPGATPMQVEVEAPATILNTPGTYRLTVVDPVRHIGDAFVVASQATTIPIGAAALSGSSSGTRTAASAPTRDTTERATGLVVQRPVSEAVSPAVFEGNCITAIGVGALANNPTGCGNTASGYGALHFDTTGHSNTASGDGALWFNTTGYWNTASGAGALTANTTGNYNVATGVEALRLNTVGNDNTATGTSALGRNTEGSYNTASGYQALYFNTTGIENVATGVQALYSNRVGIDNTAMGTSALLYNTASFNTAHGTKALYLNTTGTNNVATGVEALRSNTVGNDNTATGTSALYRNTASFNTAHGTGALYNTTTGASNVAVGDRAGRDVTTGSYNVFLGAGVWGTATDTNTIRVGLPYDSGAGTGQNQTFVAGIYGTQLDGTAHAVFIDENGQLGTVTLGVLSGTGTVSVSQLQQQLQDQQTTIADLRARLTKLEALLARRPANQ